MAPAAPALPPGVLSLHVLPAEHHDKDWDAIIVPASVTRSCAMKESSRSFAA